MCVVVGQVLHVAGDRTKAAVSSLIKGGKTEKQAEIIADANSQLEAPLLGGPGSE